MMVAQMVPGLIELLGPQDPARALGWAEKWQAAEPANPQALDALAGLQRRLRLADQLLGTLERLAPMRSGPEQAPVLRELSELHFQQGNADASIAARICG